ncbi:MAG TPA: D-glycero-beta-D-manno-heptose-7-phosphate kinase, partial [Desulfobacteraceae bacterium]|nr:D-glycero-beta-D-manno-heptose-7-phosphate kinase [Desulfobacteraceae bacterium]
YINRFSTARIMVVGDIILDRYLWGDVSRISPEAPVPVVDVCRESTMCGGAANVVNNITTLGAASLLCGVVGDDDSGREINAKLSGMPVNTDGVFAESGRPTSVKTRVVARGQQVVRFDCERRGIPEAETIEKIKEFLSDRLRSVDLVVVSDYGKGMVSAPVMEHLRALTSKNSADPVKIAVDPKTGNFQYYHDVDVITPNHHEAGAFCGFEIVDEQTLHKAGKTMLQRLSCRSVLITQGKDGMTLFERDKRPSHIPTVAKQVFDVTGAGDTVIGTFSVALASGLDLHSAALLSNFAAGIVVGQLGTSVVSAEELKLAVNGGRWPCWKKRFQGGEIE